MTTTLAPADMAAPVPSSAGTLAIDRAGRVPVERSVLFAGHAECPRCGAFVRQLTPLGPRSVVGELVAAWCTVCCTTTYFATAWDIGGRHSQPQREHQSEQG
jgi:hypothetical protein